MGRCWKRQLHTIIKNRAKQGTRERNSWEVGCRVRWCASRKWRSVPRCTQPPSYQRGCFSAGHIASHAILHADTLDPLVLCVWVSEFGCTQRSSQSTRRWRQLWAPLLFTYHPLTHTHGDTPVQVSSSEHIYRLARWANNRSGTRNRADQTLPCVCPYRWRENKSTHMCLDMSFQTSWIIFCQSLYLETFWWGYLQSFPQKPGLNSNTICVFHSDRFVLHLLRHHLARHFNFDLFSQKSWHSLIVLLTSPKRIPIQKSNPKMGPWIRINGNWFLRFPTAKC